MYVAPTWEPATSFEEWLGAAFFAGDTSGALALLRTGLLVLPVTAAAHAGEEPAAWATVDGPDRTWLLAYTSVEQMRAGTLGMANHGRVSSVAELAAGWPDPRWGLLVNAGLPVHFFLESGTVARLAAPLPEHEHAAYPGALPPVVQKLLRTEDVAVMVLGHDTRVSGYVHSYADVSHVATPSVLVDALGRSDEEHLYVGSGGSVNLLRWPAVALSQYRPAYGGVDEEACRAVAGWVIEEPPFVGLGFAPNAEHVIHEYKVDSVGLPHGSEIWELDDDGVERCVARLDGDLGRWLPVEPEPEERAE